MNFDLVRKEKERHGQLGYMDMALGRLCTLYLNLSRRTQKKERQTTGQAKMWQDPRGTRGDWEVRGNGLPAEHGVKQEGGVQAGL